MTDEIFMKRIKDIIIKEGKESFGYVGVADGGDFVMLNTGKNIRIEISVKSRV